MSQQVTGRTCQFSALSSEVTLIDCGSFPFFLYSAWFTLPVHLVIPIRKDAFAVSAKECSVFYEPIIILAQAFFVAIFA